MKNEMIERYVYDVVRRLPEKQREDLKKELITLIEDMLEERMDNGKSEKENVEAVLRELGSPAVLADKYRGEKQCLIGGEYYNTYIQVLKIVLTCVAAGMVIAAGVSFCVHSIVPGMEVNGLVNVIEEGIIGIASIPGACIQAFGILTLIFVILERNQVKLQDKGDWKLEELPTVPEKKAMLSRVDSIIGIVFTVLVSIMFIYVPQLMGAWLTNADGYVVAIPVFNLTIWDQVLPLFLISMAAGLADELTKLIVGRYNLTVMWVNIATSSIVIALSLYIFSNPEIWNQGFWSKVQEVTGETIPDFSQLEGLAWMNLNNGFEAIALIIVFACVLEMGLTVYHTLRYGVKK